MYMEAVTVKQMIYHTLKERILDGQYAFGEKLNIDAICKDLSVSNSPVREALALLVKDHLVVMRPNTGAHVVELTPRIYNELTDAVNTMLLGAYEICCRRGKKQMLLLQLEQRYEDLLASLSSGDEKARIYGILYFDRCFVTATENDMFLSMFDGQLDFLYLAYVYNHCDRSIDWEHNAQRSRALIEAVREGKSELVKDILCERSNPHIAGD